MFVASIWGVFPELHIHLPTLPLPLTPTPWVGDTLEKVTSGLEQWTTVHQRWIVLSMEHCGGSTSIGASRRKASKGRCRCSGESTKDKLQNTKYTKYPRWQHWGPVYSYSKYLLNFSVSGTVLGLKDRDEQKTWPGLYEAYSLSGEAGIK